MWMSTTTQFQLKERALVGLMTDSRTCTLPWISTRNLLIMPNLVLVTGLPRRFQRYIHSVPRVLHEAPVGLIVRMCCFSLTDPFAVDMITHHGDDEILNVVLHPEVYAVQQIKMFLEKHSRLFSHPVFLSQVNT